MTFDDWWSAYPTQEDYEANCRDAYQAGAASRDAEVVSLTNQRDYEYVRAENAEQERDQLSAQLEQTRTNDRIAMRYLADIKAALGHDGDYPSLIALAEKLREQLAEREEQVRLLRDALEMTYRYLRLRWTKEEMRNFYPLCKIDEALAATQDLSNLVLCEAEPVAWMQDNGCYFSVVEDEFHEIPLYKARKA